MFHIHPTQRIDEKYDWQWCEAHNIKIGDPNEKIYWTGPNSWARKVREIKWKNSTLDCLSWWRRNFFGGGEGIYYEYENILCAEEKKKEEWKGGKIFDKENAFMLRRRRTEKEREENIKIQREGKSIFCTEKKTREGKGEKYLEM